MIGFVLVFIILISIDCLFIDIDFNLAVAHDWILVCFVIVVVVVFTFIVILPLFVLIGVGVPSSHVLTIDHAADEQFHLGGRLRLEQQEPVLLNGEGDVEMGTGLSTLRIEENPVG